MATRRKRWQPRRPTAKPVPTKRAVRPGTCESCHGQFTAGELVCSGDGFDIHADQQACQTFGVAWGAGPSQGAYRARPVEET